MSVRHSTTIDRDLMYAAVPVGRAGRVLAVSRVAYTLAALDEQVADLRRAVVVALLVAFGVALVLSLAVSHGVLAPLPCGVERG